MAGPNFPIPVPRVRVGESGTDQGDTGPTVPGDQQYDPDIDSLYGTHRGVSSRKNWPQDVGGKPTQDLFAWDE